LGESQIRLEVPLIRIPSKGSPVGSDSNLPSMDMEALSASVAVDVGDPTSMDVDLPPSFRSVALPVHPPDGPTELPNAKKRRVMFADE